jgi:hypothetical protein
MSSRTYYRGPEVVVTDRLFVWHTTPTKGFVVRDLRKVELVRTHRNPFSAYAAAAVVASALATWLLLGTSAAYVTGVMGLAILPFVFTTGRRFRPRRWELRATYRGHQILLFASSDSQAFHQVARGLRRAVEDCRPPATARYRLVA